MTESDGVILLLQTEVLAFLLRGRVEFHRIQLVILFQVLRRVSRLGVAVDATPDASAVDFVERLIVHDQVSSAAAVFHTDRTVSHSKVIDKISTDRLVPIEDCLPVHTEHSFVREE